MALSFVVDASFVVILVIDTVQICSRCVLRSSRIVIGLAPISVVSFYVGGTILLKMAVWSQILGVPVIIFVCHNVRCVVASGTVVIALHPLLLGLTLNFSMVA